MQCQACGKNKGMFEPFWSCPTCRVALCGSCKSSSGPFGLGGAKCPYCGGIDTNIDL